MTTLYVRNFAVGRINPWRSENKVEVSKTLSAWHLNGAPFLSENWASPCPTRSFAVNRARASFPFPYCGLPKRGLQKPNTTMSQDRSIRGNRRQRRAKKSGFQKRNSERLRKAIRPSKRNGADIGFQARG